MKNQGFTFIELMEVIVIIGILAAVSLKSYMPCYIKAHIISIVGGFDAAKRDSHIYYALNGTWPENNEQALQSGILKNYDEIDDKYEIMIDQGAIHFKFNKRNIKLEGDTITLRPVIDTNYPDGPIHWICGNKNYIDNWTVFGLDHI